MTIEEFVNALQEQKIQLTKQQLNQLELYYTLLVEYNEKMNLTGITEKKEVYLKHFYDSVTLTKIIDLNTVENLCDIGTGAGFPGMVLAIIFPNLKVTLLDSLQKRIYFLEKVKETLNLKNVICIHARAEEYAKQNRNKFDITTARAVSHTSTLLEYAIPMTKINGYFIPLKANMEQELTQIDHASKELNALLKNKIEFHLPIEESKRTILLFEKIKDNRKYPRKYSEIKKNRL